MVEQSEARGRRRDSSRAPTGRLRDAFTLRLPSGEVGAAITVFVVAVVLGVFVPGISDFYWYYLIGSTIVAAVAAMLVSRAKRRKRSRSRPIPTAPEAFAGRDTA